MVFFPITTTSSASKSVVALGIGTSSFGPQSEETNFVKTIGSLGKTRPISSA